MGAVYEAEDIRLKRHVALKFLHSDLSRDPQVADRFEREARAASSLNHPHICTLYDIGDHEGGLFLIMELLEGRTLKQMLRGHPLDIAKVLDWSLHIAEALDAAHAKNIVHRDIKPANIFITDRDLAKILDFGIAKIAPPTKYVGDEPDIAFSTTAETLTSAGVLLGTVPYMSPEQARGKQIDQRSDLFSFGVVLYEMATGSIPFQGNTTAEVFESILTRAPIPATKLNVRIPAELESLIGKLIEKDRNLRYQHASEVRADILRLQRERLWTGIATEQAPAGKSLAVLYFENLGSVKDEEYFRDGITEDVITELTKIQGLRLFPRSAVLAYRDKPGTAPEIGRQLNAAYLLHGSLRRAANRVRVTVQLVETRGGHSIWAEKYDRELTDIFEVQDDIARNIAQALRITLSLQEEMEIARTPTKNPQAYDYYLRGRSYARRCTRADLEFATQMYEHAIALDGNFAPAHAGLANVCGLFYDWHEHSGAWLAKGRVGCERALALEPGLADALAAGARICWAEHKYDEAIRGARAALERKADCEGAYWTLGQALFATDRWQELVDLAPRALEMSGDDYNVYVPLHTAAQRLGQLESARSIRRQQQEALERHLEWVPEDVRARILLACNYAFFQQEADAMRELQKAVALRPDDSNILYNAACGYGILKKKTDALALLKRASEAGLSKWDWVARDPDLEILHDEPQFQQIVERGKQRG